MGYWDKPQGRKSFTRAEDLRYLAYGAKMGWENPNLILMAYCLGRASLLVK